jgi:ATP-dependent Clp protease protease subunit
MLSLLSILLLAFSPFNCGHLILSRRALITTGIISSSIYKNSVPIAQDDGENNELIYLIKNNIYYSGPLTERSIFAISSNLINLQHRDNSVINLHIKSSGGSLLPTLGLVDLIRTSDTPVNTYVDGYAASAATLISIVGANRYINKYGIMLVHQLRMGNEYNKYDEIKDYAENADMLMQIIKDIYLEHTNFTLVELNELLHHDIWLNSTQCKNYGLVDIIY